MRKPSFVVVSRSQTALTIKDVGPWDIFPSVTNSAEEVVEDLLTTGFLMPGMQLFYYDSEGVLDEILIMENRFAGFAPASKKDPLENERAGKQGR